MNTEVNESTSAAGDNIAVEIAVSIDGIPADAPPCRELGLLLVARGRQHDAIAEIRELIGLPDEFGIQVALGHGSPELERPVIVDPSALPDLTIHAQECVECSAYSWSKGCSSWPW